jgi:hypothetical protein
VSARSLPGRNGAADVVEGFVMPPYSFIAAAIAALLSRSAVKAGGKS